MNWLVRSLPMDLTLSACIVFAASAVCVSQVPAILAKARLTEPLIGLGTARLDAVEAYALQGRLIPSSERTEAAADNARTQFVYERDGSSLLVSGGVDPRRSPFRLGLRPALDDAGIGWTVLWLCGQREPPAGWSAVSPPLVQGLAPEQLPSVCARRAAQRSPR
jgi:hypothetical protein